MKPSLVAGPRRFACFVVLAAFAPGGCTPVQSSSFDAPSQAIGVASADRTEIREASAGRSLVGDFLTAYSSSRPPKAFEGVCRRYAWACSRQTTALSDEEALQIANAINIRVNSQIRPVPDRQLYGVAELWTLPEGGAGDCEDYALLKKKLLVEAGLPGSMLLLATALNRQSEPHAVLVLRLASGDLILDNETSAVKPWHRTGHTYLKMQLPENPSQWSTVLLGPLASRG